MKIFKKAVHQESFGFYHQKELFVISLKNDHGMQLQITNFAATIMNLEVSNAHGTYTNVVVGFDTIQEYIEKSKNKESGFLGASIGRYAGRISSKKILINDVEYPIYHEDGVHLHGGEYGFDTKVWDIDVIDEDGLSVTCSYLSEHMEEGYPGNLRVKVIYQLTNDNELKITYQAVSDQDTIINLTNHAYYNLNGKNSITNHVLQLNCSNYLEVDKNLLPTGVIKPVLGTKFDFVSERKLDKLEEQGIIDDTFIFDQKQGAKATISAKENGIKMELFTNQPAVVIYTQEKFPDLNFRKGVKYSKFPAICFETQNYPDAPNHSNFPSATIKAGELYENRSVFKFSTISI